MKAKQLSKAAFLKRLNGGLNSGDIYHKGCGGVRFNVTSRMAQAMGVLETRCDKCGQKFAEKVVQDDPKPQWYE